MVYPDNHCNNKTSENLLKYDFNELSKIRFKFNKIIVN